MNVTGMPTAGFEGSSVMYDGVDNNHIDHDDHTAGPGEKRGTDGGAESGQGGDGGGKAWGSVRVDNDDEVGEGSGSVVSPVAASRLREELEISVETFERMGVDIQDEVRRDKLLLPIPFLRSLPPHLGVPMLKERACIAMVFLIRRTLQRTIEIAWGRWRHVLVFHAQMVLRGQHRT